jgi:hypothetical protein
MIPPTLYEKISTQESWKQKIEVGLVDSFEILACLNKEYPLAMEYFKENEALRILNETKLKRIQKI